MKEDEVRQRIIQSARDKFFAMGFSKVTMDELAQQLGISKKTMYELFRSKDELMDAVIELQMAQVGGKVKEITHSSDDFITKLYNLWEFIGHLVCHISAQFRDDVRRFRPDIWQRIEEMRRRVILGNFTKMIDEGIRLGLVREDVNKDVMVLMYLSAVQGVVNPELLAQNSFSIGEAFRTIMTVYLDGILTDRARKLFHTKLSHQLEAQPV
jgi:AcrR family transcriptional regulator